MTARRRIRSAAIVAAACALLTGCSLGDDRATGHAEQARAHLEAGRLDEALIELNSALRLAPEEPDHAEQIARVLIARGDLAEARFYLGEAYRLDPTRESAAVMLAQLLLGDDPDQANELLAEVLERNPDSAWARIGLAEQALVAFDVERALVEAERAVELDPQLAAAHWELARAHEARIRERTLRGEATDDAPYEAALAAIERFGELEPERRWQGHAERARVLAAWPGHEAQAEAAIREASRMLGELELAPQEDAVLELGLELARNTSNLALEKWALERRIEIAPRNYTAWEELAAWAERQGESSLGVYLRMIETLPEETEPHVRHARWIQREVRPNKAIAYLRKQIGQGFDDPALLMEIARIHLAAGRRNPALATVAQLELLHPEARETQIMLAWASMETGRPDQAVQRLSALDWAQEHIGALRLLTDAYVRLGDAESALDSLEHAIELMPYPDVRSLRIRARLLTDAERYAEARRAFRSLSRTTPLDPVDLSMLARCYIETGGRAVGIRMLERLVDLPDPPEIAVHELYVREGRSPAQRERLRRAFARLLEDMPNHPGVLDAMARFEIDAGTPERARPPIDASLARAVATGQPTGRLSLLLARLDAAEGETRAARDRVLAILDSEPTLPGVLEFGVSIYPDKESALAAIAELTDDGDRTELPASHHALLGRLYYRAGNVVMSRWSYEQALTGGLELPLLKNDLAFLLAKQGRDLKRAELLARQAVQEMPGEAGVIDTLGYVLLQGDEYDRAVGQFRRALEMARDRGAPQATIQYHLGLALSELERFVEAEQAFAVSLELGEDFPDEAAARQRLAVLRGEI